MGRTYFVEAEYTDPDLVQTAYSTGAEIADHTFTHPAQPGLDEITADLAYLEAWAQVPNSAVRGFRAPFLNFSEATFEAIASENFLYDNSMSNEPGSWMWPYTLDYGVASDCWGASNTNTCLQNNYPGLWEIPMEDFNNVPGDAAPVGIMDFDEISSDSQILAVMQQNFLSHYNGNRSPFGIYLHVDMFFNWAVNTTEAQARRDLLIQFFQFAQQYENVWIVTLSQLIDYMKNPVTVDAVSSIPSFSCSSLPSVCSATEVRTCNYMSGTMRTCASACPADMPSLSVPAPNYGDGGSVGCGTPTTCTTGTWDNTTCTCSQSVPSGSDGSGTSGSGSSGSGSGSSSDSSSASSIFAYTTVHVFAIFSALFFCINAF